jgi:tetratricopeptide (TPR) repeat protein
MSSSWVLCVLCVAVLIGQGLAENAPISWEIELPDINKTILPLPLLQLPVNGTHVEYRIVKVGDLMEILNRRIEPANPLVRDEALLMVAKFSKPEDFPASSGPTIKQICSIYSYLKNGDYPPINGWVYVPDPRGTEYFNYANESVRQGGRSNCTGAGDCDDFAVLMASLVESIGGTSRIVLAYNNSTGGHAYAEVYLGNLRSQSCQVNDIIDWLKKEYNTANIFTYNDTNSGDVWLNLDWGPDENGSAHPGGPFFQAPLKLVLYVNKTSEKTVPELLPARKEEERQSPAAPLKITVDLIENESKEFWYNKGNALYELGKYDEAIEAYEQAIRLDPNYAAAWNNRGITLYERGQNDEAIASYNMALGIDPQYPDSLYNKGSVSKRFVPSNYRGDSGDIGLEMSCNESPHSGLECIRIDYSASGSSDARWAGINWVYPAHNYGSLPGLQDVFAGARHLTVWARGMNGGEKAEFGMGGVAGRFSDSVRPAVSTGTVTLSKDWKNYSINLTSKNLSQVICGFYWKTDAISNPSGCTIYLDDIRYEWS